MSKRYRNMYMFPKGNVGRIVYPKDAGFHERKIIIIIIIMTVRISLIA